MADSTPLLTEGMNALLREVLLIVKDESVCTGGVYPLILDRITQLNTLLMAYVKGVSAKLEEQDEVILQLAIRPTISVTVKVAPDHISELHS